MPLSLAPVACLLLASTASAYICSDFTGVQCSASTVFSLFRSGYLLAETNYAPLFPAPRYIRYIRGFGPGYVHLLIDTHNGQDTCIIGLTGRPDHYILHCKSEPHTAYAMRMAFADYNNCYVGKSDNHRYGCVLIVKETATPRALSRCLRGLARVCPGPLFTTWNQQCVRGCSYRSNHLPWSFSEYKKEQ
ncbi:uncharacterized protein LOC144144956 [Haemaphysalis longicornis]